MCDLKVIFTTLLTVIPGKVAVLKGELESSLPGWDIVVGPNEAIQITRFLKLR